MQVEMLLAAGYADSALTYMTAALNLTGGLA